MLRIRKINHRLLWIPKVEVKGTATIRITTGTRPGAAILTCTQDLDMWAASQLVREIRRAMRQIRDDETARLLSCVNRAEGEL